MGKLGDSYAVYAILFVKEPTTWRRQCSPRNQRSKVSFYASSGIVLDPSFPMLLARAPFPTPTLLVAPGIRALTCMPGVKLCFNCKLSHSLFELDAFAHYTGTPVRNRLFFHRDKRYHSG